MFAAIAGIMAAAPAIITGGLAAWSWGAFALGAGLSMLSRALMPSISSSTTGAIDGGTTASQRDAITNRKLIYGETRVGGAIVFMDTTSGDGDNENLHLVIAFAGHGIEEYVSVWGGENKIWGSTDFEFINKIGTTSGSKTVRVTMSTGAGQNSTDYLFYAGNQITISNASNVGGINPNGVFTITATDPAFGKWFEFEVSSNATSNAGFSGGTFNVVQLGYLSERNIAWGDHYQIYFYDGTQTAANSQLVAFSTIWNTNCILQGTAYLYVKLNYDAEVFRSGMPNISATIKGKKVANLSGTVEYSDNPALCIRDYMTDTRYGMGEDASTIDIDALTTAVNSCNETITLEAGGTEKRYTINGLLDTGKSRKANIEDMLTSMGGKLVYSGAQYFINAANYVAPTVTIDETLLTGEMQIQTRQSRRQLYNAVKGSFISKEKNYIVADYPAQKSASFATADGGELFLDMALPFVTGNTQAQRLAKIAMLTSRKGTTVTIPCNLAALRFKAGDNIMVSNAKMGWVSKVFEVLSYKLHANSDGTINVDVSAVETASAIYDWATSDQKDFLNAAEVTLFNGKDVAPPTSLLAYISADSLSDGTKENNITTIWTASPDPFLTHYVVRVKPTAGGNTIQYLTKSFYFKIPNLLPSTQYTIVVAAVNELGFESTTITANRTTEADFVPDVPSIYRISKSGNAAPTTAEFLTAASRNPKNADAVITTDTSTSPVQTHAWTYNLSGTAWAQDDNFISGDLVVAGSITGNEIKAETITANKLSGDVSELFPVSSYANITLSTSLSNLQQFDMPAPQLGISKRQRVDLVSKYVFSKNNTGGGVRRSVNIQQSLQIASKSATGVQVGATNGVVTDGFPNTFKQRIYLAGNHLAALDNTGGVADNASGTGFGSVEGVWYDSANNRTYLLVGQATTVFSDGETLFFSPYRFAAVGAFIAPAFAEGVTVVLDAASGGGSVRIPINETYGETTTSTKFRIVAKVTVVHSDVQTIARGYKGTMELVS